MCICLNLAFSLQLTVHVNNPYYAKPLNVEYAATRHLNLVPEFDSVGRLVLRMLPHLHYDLHINQPQILLLLQTCQLDNEVVLGLKLHFQFADLISFCLILSAYRDVCIKTILPLQEMIATKSIEKFVSHCCLRSGRNQHRFHFVQRENEFCKTVAR